jgi:hypothetical protein
LILYKYIKNIFVNFSNITHFFKENDKTTPEMPIIQMLIIKSKDPKIGLEASQSTIDLYNLFFCGSGD